MSTASRLCENQAAKNKLLLRFV